MTQTELAAGLPVSVSYISLIEAGKRVPRIRVLELLAGRLGCSVDYLRTGRGGHDADDIDLDLRFAELALRSGDAEVALARYAQLAARADAVGYEGGGHDARWGLCRAHDALGNLEATLAGLEALAREEELHGTVTRAAIVTALCRTLYKLGDLARAVDVGESTLRRLEHEAGVDADELTELASTLILCHFERGDYATAHAAAQELIRRSEQRASSRARAAAYWNAGIVAEARGDVRTARTYAERALALFSETDDERRVAQVRADCAALLLRDKSTEIGRAVAMLEQSLDELLVVGTPRDVACARIELARSRLVTGNAEAAIELARAAVAGSPDRPSLERARALALLAYAYAANGDVTSAAACHADAREQLRGAHQNNRQGAAVWRELADLSATLGDLSGAVDAYRCAADAAGVPAPSSDLAAAATAARTGARQ